jgi:hypothetical protein
MLFSHCIALQRVTDCILRHLFQPFLYLSHLDLGCASQASCESLMLLASCRLKSFHVGYTRAVQEQEPQVLNFPLLFFLLRATQPSFNRSYRNSFADGVVLSSPWI